MLTSLVLSHHGHSLTAITISHMFHSAGMFAFTVPLGRLADRYGRGPVMYPGVAVALIGASLVAYGTHFAVVTAGTFLVGLGWAAANVAATAMIADHAETEVRGRAIGVNESASGFTAMAMALVTGPLIQYMSLSAAGMTAVAVSVIPLVLYFFERGRLRSAARRAPVPSSETTARGG